jgi:hypothetical protein
MNALTSHWTSDMEAYPATASSSIISALARTLGSLRFPFVFLLDFQVVPNIEGHLGKKIKKKSE